MTLKQKVFKPSLMMVTLMGLFYSSVSLGSDLSEFPGYELHKTQCDSIKRLLESNKKFAMPMIDSCVEIAHECHVNSTEKGGSLLHNSGLSSECMVENLRLEPTPKTPDELKVAERLSAYRKANAQIYFIPIGAVSDLFMLDLADYYSKVLKTPIAITPSIKLAKTAFNKKRDQYGSVGLIDDFYERFEDYSLNRKATYIGITHTDIFYEEKENWRFSFGSQTSYVGGPRVDSGDGVISTARIDFGSLDERNAQVKSSPNLRKMISRYIGEIHYKKERNDNPQSVLYRTILGLDDLDKIEEESVYRDVLGEPTPDS